MIYRNDNITYEGDGVIGTVKDLKEYFRYEIANQCMSFEMSITKLDYENFKDNVKSIMEVLDELYLGKFYNDKDIVKISEHPMGGCFIIDLRKEGD